VELIIGQRTHSEVWREEVAAPWPCARQHVAPSKQVR